jgi:hypothetical protein
MLTVGCREPEDPASPETPKHQTAAIARPDLGESAPGWKGAAIEPATPGAAPAHSALLGSGSRRDERHNDDRAPTAKRAPAGKELEVE